MKLYAMLTIAIVKLVSRLLRLLGRHGTAVPGRLALIINPRILKYLASQVRREIIVVCGTNGKTTTNNLLYSFLTAAGNKVICNRLGSNMLTGAAAVFVNAADMHGRIDADYACIELDEASARRVFRHITPSKMIITNLFRDQLDRYGEIDITMRLLKEAAAMAPDMQLFLNADDPLTSSLGRGRDCVFYGINENAGIGLNETKEGRFCPFCGEELNYNYYHYSQLGDYSCPACGFARTKPDYGASDLSLGEEVSFTLNGERIHVGFGGFYNIYNVLAAAAVVDRLGFSLGGANEVLREYKTQIGRMERYIVNGKKVYFNLSKNPAGFNQAISAVLSDKRRKDVMIVINDNDQDGVDISWLWDVDFERLENEDNLSFTVSGTRRDDMALRLKHACIKTDFVSPDRREAIERTVAGEGEVAYVLVNYTALFDVGAILKDMSGEAGK